MQRVIHTIMVSATLSGCTSRPQPPIPPGDIHEGECRVDDDCPTDHRCAESRAHLRTDGGDIVGDQVDHWCEAVSEPTVE
ncbi:MAG: hypothetical protein K0V04_06815 [Deltaproteobacteria bacterium]|nr:hypothetical protein [Deltaproteobacteria bacterium]